MSLQTKFETFKQAIEPTDNEIKKVINSHKHLRQDILQKLDYVMNTILTGSYKRKTIIRPMNDVDIFVIMDYLYHEPDNPTPQSVFNKLKKDLRSRYSNTAIRQDKPCVVLDFKHCKFELTPALENDISDVKCYKIPSSDLKAWKCIEDPDRLREYLTQANKKNPMLVPLIKMMKRCKQINKWAKLPSFEMEILAIERLGPIDSYRQGVTRLFEIYKWFDSNKLQELKIMTDDTFGKYCRETLFGNDFPK